MRHLPAGLHDEQELARDLLQHTDERLGARKPVVRGVDLHGPEVPRVGGQHLTLR